MSQPAQSTSLDPIANAHPLARFCGALCGLFLAAVLDAAIAWSAWSLHLQIMFPDAPSAPGVVALTPIAIAWRGLLVQYEQRARGGVLTAKAAIAAVVWSLGA